MGEDPGTQDGEEIEDVLSRSQSPASGDNESDEDGEYVDYDREDAYVRRMDRNNEYEDEDDDYYGQEAGGEEDSEGYHQDGSADGHG